MSEQFPRMVFRVLEVNGKHVVCHRTLISRKGSWCKYDVDGKIVSENGRHWFDSIMDAIYNEAPNAIYRASVNSKHFPLEDQIKLIDDLIEAAFEAGKWSGEISA